MKILIGILLLFTIGCDTAPDKPIALVTPKSPVSELDDSAKFHKMVDSIKKVNGVRPGKTPLSVNTSGHFIRRILNASPKEVEKALGKPDKPLAASKDCDYLPSCISTTYKNGNYEALFYNNKLKWLEINRSDLYNTNAIEWIGFSKAEPTFKNEDCVFWRSAGTRGTADGPVLTINGLRNISACKEWVIVSVDTYYNGNF